MSLQNTVESIAKEHQSKQNWPRLQEKEAQLFASLLNGVISDFQKEACTDAQEKRKSLEIVLRGLHRAILMNPMSKEGGDFLKQVLLLFFNWIENFLHDQYMLNVVSLLTRTIDNHFTLMELYNLLRQLIQEFQQKVASSATSMELSRHYVDSLDDACKGKVPVSPVKEPEAQPVPKQELKWVEPR